ncbi:MAG TPA: DegV family protein [candidate division Zixibacteria bacterium]|nr:DegV family protein [candidate division Zixibacteria bacterium]
MTLRIITDSASDISWEFADKNKIEIVPLTILYNNQTFKEDRNYNFDKHYKKYLEDKDFLPKTSQPSPLDFFKAYEKLALEGATEIIVICISGKLSGTMNSANAAANMFKETNPKVKIAIIDSKNASYAEGFLVEEALNLMKKETTFEVIVEKLKSLVKRIKSYLYIPTLKYLFKGGRISLTKYLVARLLRKKVVVQTGEDGSLQPVGAVGGVEEGIEKILKIIKEGKMLPRKIAVVYATNSELRDYAIEEIKKQITNAEIRVAQTRAAITAHVGPSAIAIISDYGYD